MAMYGFMSAAANRYSTRVEAERMPVERPQRLVQMPAAAGQLLAPLGHEGRHHRMARADLLHGRLEQRGLVRPAEHLVVADCGLVHPGPRLGVETLHLDVEGGELIL